MSLQRLSQWFEQTCDGDWEHSQAIRITTLDNPGWELSVNLEGTPLETRPFEPVQLERSDRDWLRCRVEGGRFSAWGGPRNLDEAVNVFLNWADR